MKITLVTCDTRYYYGFTNVGTIFDDVYLFEIPHKLPASQMTNSTSVPKSQLANGISSSAFIWSFLIPSFLMGLGLIQHEGDGKTLILLLVILLEIQKDSNVNCCSCY
jgi:hypothetical protein